MPRTASTARPATSRTRCRTSTGSHPKAAEDRTIPTCKLLAATAAAVALVAPAPALANLPSGEAARTYVAARAAALSGDHAASARLLAQLVESNAADQTIARQAVSEAISAGDMRLALRLAGSLPPRSLPMEARLLLAAEELRSKRAARALQWLAVPGEGPELSFLAPIVTAWAAADRRDLQAALAAIHSVPAGSILSGLTPEHRALLLLKFGRAPEAEPFARHAIDTAGARARRLRLALADGFLAAGDRARAAAMVEDMGAETGRALERIRAGRQSGMAIDTAPKAFSELLLSLAIDLNRLNNRALPVALAQVARHAAPDNSSAAIVLGAFLDARGRTDDAVAAFRSVPRDNGLWSQARDAEIQALLDADRTEEALAVARKATVEPRAEASDWARLGDALTEAERHQEAAAAYERALQLAAGRPAEERWPLLLLRASALESANRWPEARQALGAALALAPEQPLILNFLGYAKLERGEDLDAAEAMIRKASALAPDNASITDSLGWALYKRGRLDEAIEVLERAARGDPTQAEIHEHLGDALYKAGRKFEARFAWQAALTTAEDEIADRVRSKLQSGLTPATAAP